VYGYRHDGSIILTLPAEKSQNAVVSPLPFSLPPTGNGATTGVWSASASVTASATVFPNRTGHAGILPLMAVTLGMLETVERIGHLQDSSRQVWAPRLLVRMRRVLVFKHNLEAISLPRELHLLHMA
jgi:hypothetical protein